jgi:DNA-binding CsgD family transcriptional regulator
MTKVIGMRDGDVCGLVEGTSDPAFAANVQGVLVAWNRPAEDLFGVPAGRAIGRPCGAIVQGADEDGAVCSKNCAVQQAMARRQPLVKFDAELRTARGQEWCSVSVMLAEVRDSSAPRAIHIVHSIDVSRRLEDNVRNFVMANAGLSAEEARSRIGSRMPAGPALDLTGREIEILGLLARGRTSAGVADQLHIGRTTVNNHVQHILQKLNAHSRLEAIRRAEHAGLI